jgi:hypothetical protein
MRRNPEFLPVIGVGAALLLGLIGAPIWMPIAVGAIYGFEACVTEDSSTIAKIAEQLNLAGQLATRMGAVLIAYGLALTLRMIGSA